MAILDSLISLVSPGWAASRMRARIELDGLRALRGYDAGKQGGRHGRGWPPAAWTWCGTTLGRPMRCGAWRPILSAPAPPPA
jgi:hypothetical protein